jgi:arylsulfatase B
MRRRLALTLLALLVAASPAAAAKPPARPNIIILLADDMGFNDIGYNNPAVITPNLDRLAGEGVRLDRAYAMLNCTPTRAGLLTGRHPLRYGLQSSVVRPWDLDNGLPASETTLAHRLGAIGYRHRAIFGKWHLGHGRAEFHPLAHGFTEFFGHYNGAVDYYRYLREGQRDLHRGYQPVPASETRGRYLSDLVTDEAIGFLRARAADAAPFLLYVPFLNPHTPKQVPPDPLPYAAEPDPRRRLHLQMVSAMDARIGTILAEIDRLGLRDNSIVLFLSDNGGDIATGGSNLPFNGSKNTGWEGGIRVPAVVRWPAGGWQGGRRVNARIAYVDFAQTLLAAAGGRVQRAQFDGIDVRRLIAGGRDRPRMIFTMSGAEGGEQGESDPREVMAVNDGRWKLIVRRRPDGRVERLLFDLAADPGERRDLAAARPRDVARLEKALAGFRRLEGGTTTTSPSYRAPPGFAPPPDWRITP